MAKWDLSGTNLTIKTNRTYTRDELLELLKEKWGDKYGELESRDKVIFNGDIIVQKGLDGYENYINPKKSKIVISQVQTSFKSRAKITALDIGTGGIAMFMGARGVKGNKQLVTQMGEEIESFL